MSGERSDRLDAWWRRFAALGAALIIAATGLRWIDARGTDAPSGADWLADGAGLFVRALDAGGATTGGFGLWLNEARAGDLLIKVGLVVANGQWDPRLAFLVAVMLQAIGWGLTCVWLLRPLRPWTGLLLATGGVALATLPATALAVASPAAALNAAVVVVSLIHLRATAANGGIRWIGALAGCMAVALSTTGVASVIAVLGGGLLGSRRLDAARGDRGFRVFNGLLLVAGLLRAIQDADAGSGLLPGIDGGWLHAPDLAVLATWLILVGCLIRAGRRSRSTLDVSPGLPRLLVWGLVIPLLAHDLAVIWPFMTVIALVAAVHAAADIPARWRPSAWALGAGWMFVMVWGAMTESNLITKPGEWTVQGQAWMRETRRAAGGDRAPELGRVLGLSEVQADRVRQRLADPAFRRWLPASVREPIALGVPDSSKMDFVADGAPSLPALPPGARVLGSWEPTQSESAGGNQRDYASPVVETPFSLLQFPVAGRFAPPETSLWLADADGRVSQPLQPSVDATGAWRRMNVAVPRGPFSVRVTDRSDRDWVAFAEPVELGRGTWLAGKLADGWATALIFGFASLLTGVLLGVAASLRAGPNVEPGPCLPAPDFRGWPWFAVGLYATVLSTGLDPVAGGADAAGYLESARLLSEGALTEAPRQIPGVILPAWGYSPLGYSPLADGTLAPTYPTGLPLMIAAARAVLAEDVAVRSISLLHLVGGILLAYALGRQTGLGQGWSWLGAALIGLNPIYLYNGVQPLSDVPSLAWTSLALYAALRSREHRGWAAIAGFAVAISVLIRPTNLLIAPAVLILLRPDARTIIAFGLAALPGALWQGLHAWQIHGHPLATGYGDVTGAFGWRWLRPTLARYASDLPWLVSPLVWLGLLAPFRKDIAGPVRVAFGWVVASFFGLYAVYFCTHETWWYLRFVLPALPPLVILALGVLRTWVHRFQVQAEPRRGGGRVAIAGVLAAACLVALPLVQSARLDALMPARGNKVYREIADTLSAGEANGAVVMALQASGAVHHYTDRIVLRFDQLSVGDNTRAARQALDLGRPVYAVLFPFDLMMAGDRLPPGDWQVQGRWGDVELRRLRAIEPLAVKDP